MPHWQALRPLVIILLCALTGCQTTISAVSSLSPGSDVKQHSYSTAAPLRVLLYANTRFRGKSDLDPWGRSLDVIQVLAQTEWKVPSERIHRLQNRSADAFLSWLDRFHSSTPSDEMLVVYFATHQLADGTLYFAEGPTLKGKEWVTAINRLGENRTVILINDSCFAERHESCAEFSSRVIRLHACGAGEDSLEVRLKDGSPAAMDLFRPELKFLEARLQTPVNSASFLALLWLRSARDLMAEGHEVITWKMMFDRIQAVRDHYDDGVMQPHVQRPVLYPRETDFNFLRRRPNED